MYYEGAPCSSGGFPPLGVLSAPVSPAERSLDKCRLSAGTPEGGILRGVEMGGGSVGTIRLLAAPVFDCAYGIEWY